MLDVVEISRSDFLEGQGRHGPATSRPSRRVCVYCGSSPGTDRAYADAARQLGAALAEADFELVYGGGTSGLMGIVAQSVLANGGRVTGIIPTFLTHQCGTALVGSHELVVVEHMHARKQAMFDKADAFIALPGGLGTLEELVEQMTWLKLGRHAKPLIIADIGGFWHPLLKLLDHMDACGFLGSDRKAPYEVCGSVDAILLTLQAHLAASTGNGCEAYTVGLEATLLVENADLSSAAHASSRHDIYSAL